MIYFLQPLDGGAIKIGFSDDVDRRREQLEAIYRCPLAVLATMEGGRDEERAIHAQFSHLRLGRTEQFRPAADLMVFIGRPLLVGPNPEAVIALSNVGCKPIVLQMRGSEEWKAWLERVAKFNRTTIAELIDQAVARIARQIGFQEEPPER